MENNNNNIVKQMTSNQEILIKKLLKSRKFKDAEYKELRSFLDKKVTTSYDASILISYLLATIGYRKHFYNGKHKAYKKCYFCEARDKVQRYLNLNSGEKAWICEFCAINLDSSKIVPVKIDEKLDFIKEAEEYAKKEELTSAQEDLICEHREQ